MSFRLIRGCNAETVFEHFRKRAKKEGEFPEIASKYNCTLKPGPTIRERGTLQTATVVFQSNIENYGDTYYLVIRCEGGWATDMVLNQKFAVVVELAHEAEIKLYQRMRVRVTQ